jgi:hypothetical protein
MRFAYTVSELPYVVDAWTSSEDEVTVVWVFIDDDSSQSRLKVFRAAQAMMDRSPDLEFDLHIYSLECRNEFLHEQVDAEQFYVRKSVWGE